MERIRALRRPYLVFGDLSRQSLHAAFQESTGLPLRPGSGKEDSLHSDRAPGGDRDYFNSRGASAAGSGQGQGARSWDRVPVQPEAVRSGVSTLRGGPERRGFAEQRRAESAVG